MLKHRSLKFKIVTAFMAVTTFMIFVSFMGINSLKKVFTEFDYITETSIPNLQVSANISVQLREATSIIFTIQQTEDLREKLASKESFDKLVKDLQKVHQEYESIPFVAGEQAVWDSYIQSYNHYLLSTQKYFDLALSGDPLKMKESSYYIKNFLQADFNKMSQASLKIWEFHVAQTKMRSSNANSVYDSAKLLSLTVSVFGVLFALGLGLFFAAMISKVIEKITGEVDLAANETSSASAQLNSASVQLSSGATESAASLEETASSLEELSSMVKLNSDHAKEANSLSQKSLLSAENGEREISKLIDAMGMMSKSSKKIEEIINVIDDIAFQTNLLALNAAVEAARAGEQGKGFAVVADAVRNLAQRSASAAKDINTLIKENVEKTEEGVNVADASGSALKEIVTSVKKVADLNSEISAASQEQANGIEQISKAMNQLDQAIQSNAASSEQVASSSSEMSSQASALADQVKKLRQFVNGQLVPHQVYRSAKVPRTMVSGETPPQNLFELKLVDEPVTKPRTAEDIIPFDGGEDFKKADGF